MSGELFYRSPVFRIRRARIKTCWRERGLKPLLEQRMLELECLGRCASARVRTSVSVLMCRRRGGTVAWTVNRIFVRQKLGLVLHAVLLRDYRVGRYQL